MAKVKGKTAKLVNEGANLDAEIKSEQARLKKIKATLKEKLYEGDGGSFTTVKGCSLKITVDNKYKDVKVRDIYEKMVERDCEDEFWDVLASINLGELSSFFSEDEINELRPAILDADGNKTGTVKLSFSS